MNISFLLPTRNRPEKLKKLLLSLKETCNNINNYEVVLVFDNDDTAHINEFNNLNKNFNYQTIIMNRVGYDNLHIYYNEACKIAKGNWLWPWNDDCSEMLSKDWDLIVEEYNNKFCILNPWNTRSCDSGYLQSHTMFPVVPKKYVELLGHLSPWNHYDTYTERVVSGLNLLINEFRIVHTHDREEDETTKGVQYHKIPFPNEQLNIDRDKINNYLKEDN